MNIPVQILQSTVGSVLSPQNIPQQAGGGSNGGQQGQQEGQSAPAAESQGDPSNPELNLPPELHQQLQDAAQQE